MRRLLLQALLVLTMVVASVPLGLVLLDGVWPFSTLLEHATNARVLAAWWTGLVVSVGASLMAALMAAPLALLTVRTNLPGAAALSSLARLPLAVPPYLLAMAWLRLWAPKSGVLNAWGMSLELGTPFWCAVILAVAELPVVLMPLQAALSGIDPALEEAARMSGASRWRALWDASLRPTLPSLAVGMALAAASALAAFGVPILLGTGGPQPFSVLTTVIYEQLLVGTPAARDRALASAVLLAVTSTMGLLLANAAASKVSRQAQGKPGRPRLLQLGASRIPLGIAAWTVLLGVLIFPLLAMLLASIQPYPGAPLDLWGLQAHAALFSRRGLLAAVARSTLLGAGAATLCVGAALGLGVLVRRQGSKLAQATSTSLAWPYLVPGSVLALALLLVFSIPVRVVVLEKLSITVLVAGTPWMLLLAYVLKHAAVAIRPVDVALGAVGVTLDEAARMSGASPVRAFVTGTVQGLRGSLTAAWLTVFLLCLGELTMGVLLIGPDTETVGTILFELHSYASPAESAALASWMALVALLAFARMKRD